MVTKRLLSLTGHWTKHLYKIYWSQGLNHYYTLQSNKRYKCHGVTITMSDMNTVQKYKKGKIKWKLNFTVTNQKNGQILQNGQMRFFTASAVKNGQIFRNWPLNCQSVNPGRACFTYSSVHVSTLHPLLDHHHLWYTMLMTRYSKVSGYWFFNSWSISEKTFAYPYPILIWKFLKFGIRYLAVSDCNIG